jgi:hypothetical protein
MPSDTRPPLLIRLGRQVVGIAVAAGDGFQFLATDSDFELLDGSRFRRLEQVEEAVRRLAHSVVNRGCEAMPGGSATPGPPPSA